MPFWNFESLSHFWTPYLWNDPFTKTMSIGFNQVIHWPRYDLDRTIRTYVRYIHHSSCIQFSISIASFIFYFWRMRCFCGHGKKMIVHVNMKLTNFTRFSSCWTTPNHLFIKRALATPLTYWVWSTKWYRTSFDPFPFKYTCFYLFPLKCLYIYTHSLYVLSSQEGCFK